jgi:hypothetical protein
MSEEEYLPGLITIGAPLFDPVSGEGCRCVSPSIFRYFSISADEVEWSKIWRA